MSTAMSRFAVVRTGSGALRWYDVGDVAIGTSVIAGVGVCWLSPGTDNSGVSLLWLLLACC